MKSHKHHIKSHKHQMKPHEIANQHHIKKSFKSDSQLSHIQVTLKSDRTHDLLKIHRRPLWTCQADWLPQADDAAQAPVGGVAWAMRSLAVVKSAAMRR